MHDQFRLRLLYGHFRLCLTNSYTRRRLLDLNPGCVALHDDLRSLALLRLQALRHLVRRDLLTYLLYLLQVFTQDGQHLLGVLLELLLAIAALRKTLVQGDGLLVGLLLHLQIAHVELRTFCFLQFLEHLLVLLRCLTRDLLALGG